MIYCEICGSPVGLQMVPVQVAGPAGALLCTECVKEMMVELEEEEKDE